MLPNAARVRNQGVLHRFHTALRTGIHNSKVYRTIPCLRRESNPQAQGLAVLSRLRLPFRHGGGLAAIMALMQRETVDQTLSTELASPSSAPAFGEDELPYREAIDAALKKAAGLLEGDDLDPDDEDVYLDGIEWRNHCGSCTVLTVMETVWPEVDRYLAYLRSKQS